MGTIHKLRPEVRDFIIEEKKNKPLLSCRKLTVLISEQFNIKMSKSSINIVIKEAGLSAPIGRTSKKKKLHIVMPVLPILIESKLGPEIKMIEGSDIKAEEELAKKAEEERLRIEAEEAKAREERTKLEEEAAKKAVEERLKIEAEEKAKVAAEEKIRVEEELAKKAEEERLKVEAEEKKAVEEAARKAEEERLRIKAEEIKVKEEKIKAEEEAARKAEEERWLKLADKERMLKEEEEKAKLAASLKIERFSQIEGTGIILLKAADHVIGASQLITEAIEKRGGKERSGLSGIVENLIYLSLVQDKIDKPTLDKLSIYLDELENLKGLNLDIARAIYKALQEVRYVKAVLSDGSNIYLDGQMYSVWSSPHIPHDFSSPMQDIHKRIDKYFNQDSPLVLFNAPGYDLPSKDFFDFLSAMESKNGSFSSLVFCNNKLEELAVLPVVESKKRFIIFGIWPWQFVSSRRVKNIGKFRSFRINEQNRDLYIADIEIELAYPMADKQVVLRGCALKASPSDKTRIVILSNFPSGAKEAEELAGIYLSRWPNIEEAFQDYSRKIELFTYTANSQRFSLAESLKIEFERVSSIKDLLKNYLIVLDAYVRWHFLPAGYENKEFLTSRERFYSLDVRLNKVDNKGYLANFSLPADYSFARDLSYASCRINEKGITLSDDLGLYLNPG